MRRKKVKVEYCNVNKKVERIPRNDEGYAMKNLQQWQRMQQTKEIKKHFSLFQDPLQGSGVFLGFFFFAFPSYISGVHHFWVRFLRMCPFFNPTIKVVTFRLRGWCMLGVFFCCRHSPERQDLLSPCDEMHVCTD